MLLEMPLLLLLLVPPLWLLPVASLPELWLLHLAALVAAGVLLIAVWVQGAGGMFRTQDAPRDPRHEMPALLMPRTHVGDRTA
jgi:hypothetical protein